MNAGNLHILHLYVRGLLVLPLQQQHEAPQRPAALGGHLTRYQEFNSRYEGPRKRSVCFSTFYDDLKLRISVSLIYTWALATSTEKQHDTARLILRVFDFPLRKPRASKKRRTTNETQNTSPYITEITNWLLLSPKTNIIPSAQTGDCIIAIFNREKRWTYQNFCWRRDTAGKHGLFMHLSIVSLLAFRTGFLM